MASLYMLDAIEQSRMATGLARVATSALAGYAGGTWPTWLGFLNAYGADRPVMSIAINSSEIAHCLDIESGDATNASAVGWVKAAQARGQSFIVLYTSVSNASPLIATLAAAGISREEYWLWTAHYVPEHVCSHSCYSGFNGQADATQFSDTAPGPCDQTVMSEAFYNALLVATGLVKPAPTPTPVKEAPKVASTLNLVPSGKRAILFSNGSTKGFIWSDGSIWLTSSGFKVGEVYSLLDPRLKGAFTGREVATVAAHGKYGMVITDTAGEKYTLGN